MVMDSVRILSYVLQVHIVNHVDEATDCSGRGMKSGEICECDPGYIGDICQYPGEFFF